MSAARAIAALALVMALALAGCSGEESRSGGGPAAPAPRHRQPEAPTATAAPLPASSTAAPIARTVAPIDLPTVLALAGSQPNAIRFARERLALAEAQESGAVARLLPTLSIGVEFGHHDGTIQDVSGSFFDTTRQHVFVGATGEVALDIYGGIYEMLASRQLRTASAADLEATVDDRTAAGAEAYFDLVAAQAGVAIADDALAHAAEFERIAAAREAKQVGLALDRLQAQTARAEAEQAKIGADERLRVASARLATLLRLDATVSLLSGEREAIPITFVPPATGVEALIALALEHRPDLSAAARRIEAADTAETAAEVGPFVPTLHAGIGGLNGGLGVDGPSFGDLQGRQDYYVSLQWRLTGLGFGEVARARSATAQARAARVSSDEVRERIIEEVIEAHEAAHSRRAAIDVARRAVVAAEEARTLSERRLAQGAGLAVEVLAAQEARTRAASGLVEAIVAYDKAEYRLLARIGERPGE